MTDPWRARQFENGFTGEYLPTGERNWRLCRSGGQPIVFGTRNAAARLKGPVALSYFTGPIRDAYERRIKAGQGLPKPVSIAITPDDDRDPEWLAKAWPLRLERGRNFGEWFDKYGPPPGEAGCRVPAELIRPGDGRGWGRERKAA